MKKTILLQTVLLTVAFLSVNQNTLKAQDITGNHTSHHQWWISGGNGASKPTANLLLQNGRAQYWSLYNDNGNLGLFNIGNTGSIFTINTPVKVNGVLDASDLKIGGQSINFNESPWISGVNNAGNPLISYSHNVNVDGYFTSGGQIKGNSLRVINGADISGEVYMDKVTLVDISSANIINTNNLIARYVKSPSGANLSMSRGNDERLKIEAEQTTITKDLNIQDGSIKVNGAAVKFSPWSIFNEGMETQFIYYPGETRIATTLSSASLLVHSNATVEDNFYLGEGSNVTKFSSFNSNFKIENIDGNILNFNSTDSKLTIFKNTNIEGDLTVNGEEVLTTGNLAFSYDIISGFDPSGITDEGYLYKKSTINDGVSGYALKQKGDGTTYLNAAPNRPVNIELGGELVSQLRQLEIPGQGTISTNLIETLRVGDKPTEEISSQFEALGQYVVAHFDGRVLISEDNQAYDDANDDTSFFDSDSKIHENYKDYVLWVEEGIVTNDMAIAEVTDWPDYVFAPGYELNSIDALKAFINTYGHLPTFPSAKAIFENGYSLSEMNKNMVKTVEELTLHTIAQEQKIEAQNAVIQDLVKRLKKLEESSKN